MFGKSLRLLIAIPLLLTLSACSSPPEILDHMQAYHDFQDDADIVRLQHLKYYVDLIEEYHSVTGTYPFMDEANIPLYVFIANREQFPATRQETPYTIKEKSFADFVMELERALGRTIEEYYDPQYAGDYKPNFYIYMANQGTYFLAIHQHNSYPFSRRIAKNYHKIELSNNATPANGAYPVSAFLAHEQLADLLTAPLKKEAFFRDRERKHLHETKQ